jgi:3-hydroxybutyryl-CoA dehydratase
VTSPAEAVYLEDIREGQQGASAARTVTDDDIASFCELTGDFNPLHTDDDFIRAETPYRDRIAHGLLVLGMSSGLDDQIERWKILAYMEAQRRFVAPVYPGETISTRWRVESLRPSRSRPGTGIVRVGVETVNQDGVVVQAGSDVYLVASRAGT